MSVLSGEKAGGTLLIEQAQRPLVAAKAPGAVSARVSRRRRAGPRACRRAACLRTPASRGRRRGRGRLELPCSIPAPSSPEETGPRWTGRGRACRERWARARPDCPECQASPDGPAEPVGPGLIPGTAGAPGVVVPWAWACPAPAMHRAQMAAVLASHLGCRCVMGVSPVSSFADASRTGNVRSKGGASGRLRPHQANRKRE